MDNLTEYLKTQNELNGIILKLLLEIRADQLVILANDFSEKTEEQQNVLKRIRKEAFQKQVSDLYAKYSELPNELKDLLNLQKP